MTPDAGTVAKAISNETGLHFEGRSGRDRDNQDWIELSPAGHRPAETFTIRTTIGWRRLDIAFTLGSFAGELLSHISRPDEVGRGLFRAILDECVADQAEVDLRINGASTDFRDEGLWAAGWEHMELHIRRGMLPVNAGDAAEDERIVRLWARRMAAAMIAILPLEAADDELPEPDHEGLPEGAKKRVEVNRYERDRRNRAAALAIHGYACKACGLDMATRYGMAATGLIEVHHVTPVSVLGPDYRINPSTDLLPLCPNCHAVTHRRCPPYSVEEVAAMLAPTPSS